MSKRPTPETDAVRAYEGNWDTKALRMTAHARKLERERDEAQEKYATEATEHMLAVNKACSERDEARRKLNNLDVTAIHSCHNECQRPICVLRRERDEAREKLSARWQSLRDSQDEVLRLTFENRELSQSIEGWENKWKCAIDMAARAELERDEALKCAKEYYVEFIRNASSDNKVSKPNPLNPFYKY